MQVAAVGWDRCHECRRAQAADLARKKRIGPGTGRGSGDATVVGGDPGGAPPEGALLFG